VNKKRWTYAGASFQEEMTSFSKHFSRFPLESGNNEANLESGLRNCHIGALALKTLLSAAYIVVLMPFRSLPAGG